MWHCGPKSRFFPESSEVSTLQAAECSPGDGMYTDWGRRQWAGFSPLSGPPGLSEKWKKNMTLNGPAFTGPSGRLSTTLAAAPSDWTPAALLTRWSASSIASAGPSGKSRDSPMTKMRMSVSSSRGTSEQRRRKKLQGKSKGQQYSLLPWGKNITSFLFFWVWKGLTSCHSPEASCPTCNTSLVALWKALCVGCSNDRETNYTGVPWKSWHLLSLTSFKGLMFNTLSWAIDKSRRRTVLKSKESSDWLEAHVTVIHRTFKYWQHRT